MHKSICAAIAAGAFLTVAAAQAETPVQHRAVSAEAYAVQASYQSPRRPMPKSEWGYSASSRRIADCLATYPGYDPKIDRVRVRGSVTRACRL